MLQCTDNEGKVDMGTREGGKHCHGTGTVMSNEQ